MLAYCTISMDTSIAVKISKCILAQNNRKDLTVLLKMKNLLLIVFTISVSLINAQEWQIKSPYPALGRDDGIAFTINNFGFCVTGNTGNYAQSNFLYRYDANKDTWERKKDFQGEERQYVTAFTISDKAYIVGGYSKSGNGLAEVWCYNATLNMWTQKDDFPGGIRWGAISFAIANKGYFGCGTDTSTVHNDFWEYEPTADKWTQLENFIGGPRREGVACAVAGIGYMGLGLKDFTPSGFYKDWYSFDPQTKNWTKESDFPGGLTAYAKAEGSGMNAIVGSGMDENQVFTTSFFLFNILSRTWHKLPDLSYEPIRGVASFTIKNTVYFTTGLTANFMRSNFLAALIFPSLALEATLFPNPSFGLFHLSTNMGQTPIQIRVFNTSGQLIEEKQVHSDLLDYSHLKSGLYFFQFNVGSSESIIRTLVIL